MIFLWAQAKPRLTEKAVLTEKVVMEYVRDVDDGYDCY